MSTKRLQKTVIEGGRASYNKWERRYSNRIERAEAREYISSVVKNEDFFDSLPSPKREKVRKEFNDKLNPMARWIYSQIGRHWNDVHSEIFQKFDSRTTAGRHILFDHILGSIDVVPDLRFSDHDQYTSHYKNDFYVDDDGIFRVKDYIPRKKDVVKIDTKKIADWLNGRAVGFVGNKLFWFVPADKCEKYGRKHGAFNKKWKTVWTQNRFRYGYGLAYFYQYNKPIYIQGVDGVKIVARYELDWREGRPSFRQNGLFSNKDVEFWNTIPEWHKSKILAYSPMNKNTSLFYD